MTVGVTVKTPRETLLLKRNCFTPTLLSNSFSSYPQLLSSRTNVSQVQLTFVFYSNLFLKLMTTFLKER